MVLVRIKDKRYRNGYIIKFFQTDTITEEVIQFVKDNPKVYWIDSSKESYHSREEFFKAFCK